MTDAPVPLAEQIDAVRALIKNGDPNYWRIHALRAALATLQQYERAMAVVAQQANDDGLWFDAQTAAEAYLQQELRKLHAAIENPEE